ncbi:MAG: hypothetical protein JNJ60_12635 [Rhodocyclaceae bacterium]|nr:hypothetical protein [Rhodocyclaceae bacterium]
MQAGKILNAAMLLLALYTGTACAGLAEPGLSLVGAEEVAREQAFLRDAPASQVLSKSMAVPGAPGIEIDAPKLGAVLAAPFPIRVVFKPAEDAQILPDSFRVLYGFLGLDITQRVLKHVRPTPGGFSIERAEIPEGAHRLKMSVRDDRGRLGETEVNFTVQAR